MKSLFRKIVIIILCSVFVASSAQADELEDVVNYVRTGNVTGMGKYFDKVVAITINNNQASYSGAQAEIILKDFFNKNAVKDFKVVQSSANAGPKTKYAIGNLITANGDYQLYVVMKILDNKFILREIRFEKK